MKPTRRDFIRTITTAAAGIAAASAATPAGAQVLNSRSKVALIKGTDRRETLYNAMKPFQSEMEKAIQGKRVFLKVNNTWDSNPIACTHPDALRAVLDILKDITDRPVTIAESTASPKGTLATFEEYGYMPLQREYRNIRFQDLNAGTATTKWIHDAKLMPVGIEIIDEFLAPDAYWISVCIPKTHDSAIGTIGYKNMIMASPLNVLSTDPRFVRNQSEKSKMHGGGSLGFNWNMFTIGREVKPDFVAVDGYIGMEGRGPVNGTVVEHNIALAGHDVVAVDRIGLELMGINWEDTGYLQWCAAAGIGQGSRDMIDVVGEKVSDHIIKYQPHPNGERELEWKYGGTKATG